MSLQKFRVGITFKLSLTVLAALMFSCQQDEKFAGKELRPASENFALLTDFKAATKTITFSTNPGTSSYFLDSAKVRFSAKFNEEVSWDVKVVGLTSGAVTKYSGVGSEITANEISWDGRSSGLPFFSQNEYVSAYLTILGHDSTYVVDSIKTTNSYSYHRKTRNGVKQIVIDRFETSDPTYVCYKKVSLAASPDQADSQTEFIATTNMAMDGKQSYYMNGSDDNSNSWCGGINNENLIDFYLVSSTNELLIDSGVDPANLYFNLYIYGTGKANTSIQLKVYELDVKFDEFGEPLNSREKLRAYYDSIASGTRIPRVPYNQAENDGYIYDIEVTWTGWKLVSAPYSKFKPANDPLAGGSGDRKKESWRIGGMAISLLSQPTPGKLVESYIDFLTVTIGGKFQP